MVRQKLSRVVEWYNTCVKDTQKCELDIIQEELSGVTMLLQPALQKMTWEKYGKVGIYVYYFKKKALPPPCRILK